MKLKLITLALMGWSLSGFAQAQDAFTIRDIRVEGLQRTEPGTVFSYLPIKVGEPFDQAKAQEAIKALFATGFFEDIRIEAEGNNVIVSVVERPIVTELNINITGAREIKPAQIKKSLENAGLATSRPFDEAMLNRALVSLKQEYVNRGKYAAEIKTNITKLDRNRVAVGLTISEGKSTRIKDIEFIGNEAFSDKKLAKEMSLRSGGAMSWLSKSNQYSKQKLSGDLEKIKALYQNQGYLEFDLNSTQVELSPDKSDIFVTINLTEGTRYKVGDMNFVGDLKDVPENDLKKLLSVKKGQTFNRSKIMADSTAVQERLGNDGYAFAQVSVIPDLHKEEGVADFSLAVEPGRKVYVNRVNIQGNNKTRDEVIRREMRQMEGAVFDRSKVDRSKERIELLGYFDGVTVETPIVPGTGDHVDLNVGVQERNTGSANVGIGYVQGEGIQFTGSISQANIFGSGKALALSASTGDASKNVNLSFTDPYFTVDGVSLGYDLYWDVYDPNNVDYSRYKTETYGAGVRFGVPITEHDRVNFGLGVENTEVTLYPNSPSRYQKFVRDNGNSNITILGSVGWGRDKRDSALWPTRGYVVSAKVDSGLPGGDLEYYRLTHQQTWYFPVSENLTFMLNGKAGYAGGYGDTKKLPFFQNFYLGGIGSVRGFENNSLGPKDNDDDYLGGSRLLVGNAELLFPMPGLKEQRSVRLGLFADAGTLWEDKRVWNWSTGRYEGGFDDGIRYSTGLSLSWISPMGPLKFSYAYPINKKKGDKIQRFQFQMGMNF